jgi:phosphohistidine phosphatase
MKIYILRHGIAMEKKDWTPRDDRKRPLTKEGMEKIRRAAKTFQRLELDFDRILTSPYERAFKTAKIVSTILKMEKETEIWQELAADADPRAFLRKLSPQRRWKRVLLVGHDPYLSRLIARLSTGTEEVFVNLKKGGVCLLETDRLTLGRCATLKWLIPPKILEKVR